ncbi:MAG: hypothetical protein SOT81_02540 [Treponema sp.]|nr:hypothetical protein [Treponema sp.]
MELPELVSVSLWLLFAVAGFVLEMAANLLEISLELVFNFDRGLCPLF